MTRPPTDARSGRLRTPAAVRRAAARAALAELAAAYRGVAEPEDPAHRDGFAGIGPSLGLPRCAGFTPGAPARDPEAALAVAHEQGRFFWGLCHLRAAQEPGAARFPRVHAADLGARAALRGVVLCPGCGHEHDADAFLGLPMSEPPDGGPGVDARWCTACPAPGALVTLPLPDDADAEP